MEQGPLKLLVKESMLAMIEASLGSTMFRTLYAEVNGEKINILGDGDVSCAYYVSTILHQFKLIVSPHATVTGLMRDMESLGWEKIEVPEIGDVLIWEPQRQTSEEFHLHCGFYMGGEEAVSNDFTTRVPARHHYTSGVREDGSPARAIIATYRHPQVS